MSDCDIIPDVGTKDLGRRTVRGGATFHYVPYSEHCDYQELQEALRIVGARRVVEV